MGAAKNGKKGEKTYTLTDKEYNLVKMVNIAMQFNLYKDKALSGIFYLLASTKFGYKEEQNLEFEIDLDKDDKKLIIREIPDELVEQVKKATA